jgi:2-methylcitrate dehydratase PrpD
MALGLRYGRIDLKHFEDNIRADAGLAEICKLVHVRTAADLDALYPSKRPARVKLVTTRGEFSREAHEAIGSRDLPLDDDGLARKFTDLVAPVRGQDTAQRLLAVLRQIEDADDVSVLLDLAALPAA